MQYSFQNYSWLHWYRIVFVLLLSVNAFIVVSQDIPALPDTKAVITCFPDTTGYVRFTVGPVDRDFTDLQQAINAAPLGSVLVLDAGETFYGGFILPDKGIGEEWIILISSRMDLIANEEARIQPSRLTGDDDFPTEASAMPKIITNNLTGIPAIKTQAFAHHYRLTGIEIAADPTVINSYGLVNLGESSNQQDAYAEVPHHFIIDRCYIHGHDDAEIMKYGVRMDCIIAAIIDCHISQFHSIGFDAQAISGINGPGQFKILNNYLEASGENILFGGGGATIPGLVPSDIEIRNNHFFKPWSWRVGHPDYTGKHWTIKNLFELKTGIRVLLDGNILENCWADIPIGQSGYAILLTVRTEGGASPQADVSDIMISNNIIRHVGAGITLSGSDGVPSNRSSRIMVYNNLFEDINGPIYGDQNVFGPNDGTFLKIGQPQDVIIDHNTIFQTGPITWAFQVTDRFVYTNNLSYSYTSSGGYQGIYGPGQTQGNATIAAYFPDVTDANMHFHKNVLIGGNPSRYSNFNTLSENYFPADVDEVMFVDYPGGSGDYRNYALTTASPFYQSGSDGKDIGVNFDELYLAQTLSKSCDSMSTATVLLPKEILTVTLYPNPASDVLDVLCKVEGSLTYCVYDLFGKFQSAGESNQSAFKIDTRKLISGLYILCIAGEDVQSSRLFAIHQK